MNRCIDFLRRLSANNNRPWFQEHKEEYETIRAKWLADLDRLIGQMTLWQPDLAGQTGKTSAYRIYRDTRFSPDKTPYKTYLSALISPYGRKSTYASYYIQVGLDPDNTGLFGGLWCPEAPVLRKLRHAMVDNIEELEQILANPDMETYFPGWCGSRLKTVPKGWDRNHPQAELLRLKDIGKQCLLPLEFFDNPQWPVEAAGIFRTLKPFIDFINYSIDE